MQPHPAIVKEVAEYLEAGFYCYVHKQTGELVMVPDENSFSSIEPGEWRKDRRKVERKADHYFCFRPQPSHDRFRLMENFLFEVEEERLKELLVSALQRRKPFAHFEQVLGGAGPYRDRWFRYQLEQDIARVEQEWKAQLFASEGLPGESN